MVEQNCWDGIPMGLDEDLESILNNLEFPLESLDEDWDDSVYQFLKPIPLDDEVFLNELSETQGTVSFQTQSPVSVLEQSSSCFDGKSISFKSATKRRRSKRAQSSTLSPWLLMAPISCTPFKSKKNSDAKKGKEKKRRNLSQLSGASVKKCTHCEITKTPLWREGPLGPKTLCNACGVRYRSGRLFPEYRPASSPTFVPSLHSNSHRKVTEMRKKALTELEFCSSG